MHFNATAVSDDESEYFDNFMNLQNSLSISKDIFKKKIYIQFDIPQVKFSREDDMKVVACRFSKF